MFQVREKDSEHESRQEIRLSSLWKQDFLQTQNKGKKSQSNLIKMKDRDKKIQEMQMLEQNLQNLLFQKQAFQMELSETKSALKEIENSGDEVFKIIGQLMIKTDKTKMKEELSNKEKIITLRIKSIEKQETPLAKKLDDLQKEIVN